MIPPRRACALALSLLLSVGLSVATGAGPASASVSTLCTGYTGCADVGLGNAGYASASRTMYWRMYAGHNCTNYVAYRMVRAGLPNSRPWSGSGNATNWGSAMSRITTSTPTVGSVAWWRAGVRPAGSAGHVAYVERVVSADEIIVSQDSWHGDFSWTRVTRASSGWPSGFVHFADARRTAVGLPSVSGTAKVGSTLTASRGAWSPTASTYRYQWLADGIALPGATASTLTLTSQRVGASISVRVTAAGAGFADVAATSVPTAAVRAAKLVAASAPGVVGQARVGEPLTASPGTWNPVPDGLRYQWTADGATIAAATGSTFVPGADLVGHRLAVRVTADKAGYPSVSRTSAPTGATEPGALPAPARPAVTGRATPGGRLAVTPPPSPAGAELTVQWLRDGGKVRGATGPTYAVTAADLGTGLSARLTWVKPGYLPLEVRSRRSDRIKVQPRLRVATTPGRRSLALRATVRARDVASVEATLRVRYRGRIVADVPVHAGVATATVRHLRPGRRTVRFAVVPSPTLSWTGTQRRVTVRR